MKEKASRLNILILSIILGFLISIQIRNINDRHEYVSLDTIRDYKQSLEKERTEIEKIELQIEDIQDKIDDYRTTKIRDGDITKALNDEVNKYKMISGLTNVHGPGVIIIIDDATRELIEGEDPNAVLVHDMDLLNIINDLKTAGAEAISINNQRILSSTEIDCSGFTIEINGQDYGHPYIIKAIGEPGHLEAAINGPITTGYLLKEYGIFVEVNVSAYITIPKYDGDMEYEYLITKK
ncbi:MAG: DUF881 domain-containing protein [Clostridia bacterium]|nr:DUF881 domain-containing protein [Clostridia bacterium]